MYVYSRGKVVGELRSDEIITDKGNMRSVI
jgi:hypothetical protein